MADNQDQDENQQPTGSGLRAQLEQALEEINTLKDQLAEGETARRELAFTKAGIDISEGTGKLLAKTYDGDLDPEAITTFAQEYGIEPGQAQKEPQADQTQQRMDSLRSQSQPDGVGERMSMQEFFQLNAADPAGARQAMEAGQVDVPPHVAQQLAANGHEL